MASALRLKEETRTQLAVCAWAALDLLNELVSVSVVRVLAVLRKLEISVGRWLLDYKVIDRKTEMRCCVGPLLAHAIDRLSQRIRGTIPRWAYISAAHLQINSFFSIHRS